MRAGVRQGVRLAVASAVVTMVCCFAASELWMRLTKPYMTPDTERAAALEYEVSLFARNVLPQQPRTVRGADGEERYAINRLGYRGRPFSLPKPPGVIRVVILGGSAAFDINAPEGRDWPRLVESYLHRAGHANVEVVNAAVPGHATWDVLGRLYSEIWAIEPDYVLVYEAWNDVKYFRWLTPTHSLLRTFRPSPMMAGDDGMVANPFIHYTGPIDRLLCHSQVYTRLRRRFWWWYLGEMGVEGLIKGPEKAVPRPPVGVATYAPWGVRQYELDLRLIADAARDIGAVPVYLTQARLITGATSADDRAKAQLDYVGLTYDAAVRAFADCDRAVHHAAALQRVPLLDLSLRFSGRSELFTDHVHLSAAGSDAVGTAVGEFLDQLLKERSALS